MRHIHIEDTTDDIHGEGVTITFRNRATTTGFPPQTLHDSRLKPAHVSIMQAWLRGDDEVFGRLMHIYGRDELALSV